MGRKRQCLRLEVTHYAESCPEKQTGTDVSASVPAQRGTKLALWRWTIRFMGWKEHGLSVLSGTKGVDELCVKEIWLERCWSYHNRGIKYRRKRDTHLSVWKDRLLVQPGAAQRAKTVISSTGKKRITGDFPKIPRSPYNVPTNHRRKFILKMSSFMVRTFIITSHSCTLTAGRYEIWNRCCICYTCHTFITDTGLCQLAMEYKWVCV